MFNYHVAISLYYQYIMQSQNHSCLWLPMNASPTVQSLLSWPLFALRITPGLILIILRTVLYVVSTILNELEHFMQLTVFIPTYLLYLEANALTEVMLTEGDTSTFRLQFSMAVIRSLGYVAVIIRASLIIRSKHEQPAEITDHSISSVIRVNALSCSPRVAAPVADVLNVGSADDVLKHAVVCGCASLGISQSASLSSVMAPATGSYMKDATKAFILKPLSQLWITYDGCILTFALYIVYLANMVVCYLSGVLTGRRICHAEIAYDPVLMRTNALRSFHVDCGDSRVNTSAHEVQMEEATTSFIQTPPLSAELNEVVIVG